LQVVHGAVLVCRASLTHILQKLQDRVLAVARYPSRRVDAHAFGERIEDLHAGLDGELVHLLLSFGSV
jgi:hypothetical protein